MTRKTAQKRAVLILDGQANALSIVRSLGRQGVPIYLSAPAECYALHSRYCQQTYLIPEGVPLLNYWHKLLLEDPAEELKNAILFPCSDKALEFVIAHQAELEKQYILEGQSLQSRQELLDKQHTLRVAKQAGISIPEFWQVKKQQDVIDIMHEVSYPAIIKPIHSHLFQAQFDGQKYLAVQNAQELLDKASRVLKAGLEFMVSEYIPGPDSLLCSYFTYHDQAEQPLYHFTKRIKRRYPVNHGGATYHVTEWQPEVAKLGQKLLAHIHFTGLCNMEFKRDLRDGQLKLIEINARFVASQELVYQSGMDIAQIVYKHLDGQTPPKIEEYQQHLHLWIPDRDFHAFRQLKQRGELSFSGWLKSLAHWQVVNYFKWHDPLPWLIKVRDDLSYIGSRLLHKLEQTTGGKGAADPNP